MIAMIQVLGRMNPSLPNPKDFIKSITGNCIAVTAILCLKRSEGAFRNQYASLFNPLTQEVTQFTVQIQWIRHPQAAVLLQCLFRNIRLMQKFHFIIKIM
ncbi:hypothetical protein D3C71_1467900 [compost metagenome]